MLFICEAGWGLAQAMHVAASQDLRSPYTVLSGTISSHSMWWIDTPDQRYARGEIELLVCCHWRTWWWSRGYDLYFRLVVIKT